MAITISLNDVMLCKNYVSITTSSGTTTYRKNKNKR